MRLQMAIESSPPVAELSTSSPPDTGFIVDRVDFGLVVIVFGITNSTSRAMLERSLREQLDGLSIPHRTELHYYHRGEDRPNGVSIKSTDFESSVVLQTGN